MRKLLTRYDHLAELVRPLLWGMMPADFRRWLEDCRALAPWVRLDVELGRRAWDGLHVGAAGETRSEAVARFLNTERPCWGRGASLRTELRARLSPFGGGAMAEEEWALMIADRVCVALAAEMRAWRLCVDSLARGVWHPAPTGELPDASDVRFVMHPSRALEDLCTREASVELARSGVG